MSHRTVFVAWMTALVLMIPALGTASAGTTRVDVGVEDGDCSILTCAGLTYEKQTPVPGVFSVDFVFNLSSQVESSLSSKRKNSCRRAWVGRTTQ